MGIGDFLTKSTGADLLVLRTIKGVVLYTLPESLSLRRLLSCPSTFTSLLVTMSSTIQCNQPLPLALVTLITS